MPSHPRSRLPLVVTEGGWSGDGTAHRAAAVVIAVLTLASAATWTVLRLVRAGAGAGETVAVAAVVLGCLVAAVLAWSAGRRRGWLTGQRLWVSGDELVVEMPGTPAVRHRLDGLRCTVRLEGGVAHRDGNGLATPFRTRGTQAVPNRRGPVHSAMSIRPGEYFVPFHPVLRLRGDGTDPITVELCHLASRRMRDRDQLLTLAELVARTAGPDATRAAGRLRTLADWQRLPHITDADPDAVPETPADRPAHEPVIPTPVRAGVPAAEIHIPGARDHAPDAVRESAPQEGPGQPGIPGGAQAGGADVSPHAGQPGGSQPAADQEPPHRSESDEPGRSDRSS
ncbi:hypothetical protein LX16_0368 [Stackebrandtia albiflava]|uniref:Uncharacterized protein n=1 Tax=Stackebrandtia albiflava TaxID=406432 RepID=A0A562VA17_9ACTN|nr:hypothetical protein [Stackebrandtia albiflava]TWJ14681.1 hypothetical protein LX16_0368 [Stackebrandtia albiflava]